MSAEAVEIRLGQAAREVALAEAQAVLAMVQDEGRRGRIAELVADADEGVVSGASADALEELLELGLSTGRIRAIYGPDGEQAALSTFRRLPRGAELAEGAREVTAALATLEGARIDGIQVTTVGPGAYVVAFAADGREVSVRLDRQGARVHSIGV